MQVRSEKHDGASKISARVDGIHQFLLTHIGYGNDLPLACIIQIRSEMRHGAIRILALGIQVRRPDGLWAIMRGRLRTQENRPKLQSIRALLGKVAPATMTGIR